MAGADDLAAYIADNYGTCDRAADCYWGKDGRGDWNGCLRTGWRGRACSHWHPINASTWEELKSAQSLIPLTVI